MLRGTVSSYRAVPEKDCFVDTVEEQIDIARRKGGISPDDDYRLQRFEVVRYK